MKKFRKGQSIVELVIASGVMVIIMSAAAGMMSMTEKQVEQMSRQSQANAIAEEGVQAVISIADRSWTELSVGSHGLAIGSSPVMWVFQGVSDTSGDYSRTIVISTVDSDTKKVVITVTWHPSAGRTATVEQQLLLTDWAFI